MLDLPIYIYIVFFIAVFLTVVFFYFASGKSKVVLVVSLVWLAITGVLGQIGFYENTSASPPRFLFLPVPAFLLIIIIFLSKQGREFIDRLSLEWLTILQSVRILVELVIFWWFIQQLVPKLMTFEGRNFDILAGMSAPVIWYLCFNQKRFGKKLLLVWNFVCLGLVLNIVFYAVLSSEVPFQKFAFDQPNRAVLYFPFIWLPGYIVPVVIFSHLASIRKLVRGGDVM